MEQLSLLVTDELLKMDESRESVFRFASHFFPDQEELFDGAEMFIPGERGEALVRPPDFFEKYVQLMNEEQFFRMFRMNKSTFLKISKCLTEAKEAAQNPESRHTGRPSIPMDKKILITIMYLSSQVPMYYISNKFAVGEATISRSISEVIDLLVYIMPNVIIWPNEEEMNEISAEFELMSRPRPSAKGFPGVVGAVDGCDIACVIEEELQKDYLNRKMFTSIRLQAVCSARCLFTQISVGCPGSVHDATALAFSQLNAKRVGDAKKKHIVGDKAYGLEEWCQVPFKDNGRLTAAQKNFNLTLSKARVKIEHSFGLLKGRWRRLSMVNSKSIEKSCKIIVACCVLHNFCLREGDSFSVDLSSAEQDEENDDPAPASAPKQAATSKRISIMNSLVS